MSLVCSWSATFCCAAVSQDERLWEQETTALVPMEPTTPRGFLSVNVLSTRPILTTLRNAPFQTASFARLVYSCLGHHLTLSSSTYVLR